MSTYRCVRRDRNLYVLASPLFSQATHIFASPKSARGEFALQNCPAYQVKTFLHSDSVAAIDEGRSWTEDVDGFRHRRGLEDLIHGEEDADGRRSCSIINHASITMHEMFADDAINEVQVTQDPCLKVERNNAWCAYVLGFKSITYFSSSAAPAASAGSTRSTARPLANASETADTRPTQGEKYVRKKPQAEHHADESILYVVPASGLLQPQRDVLD